MRVVALRPLGFLATTLALSVPLYGLNRLDAALPYGLPPSTVMIAVPATVAGGLLAHDEGRPGVRRWLSSLLDARRTPPRFLLTAALVVPATHLIAMGVFPSAPRDWPRVEKAAVAVAVFTLGAIPEELGWTTYATRPLQDRLGPTRAGLVIGGVWALWHVVPWRSMGRSWWWIAGQSMITVAMRVIMGHLYRASGDSTSTAVLVHACSNASLQIVPGATESRRVPVIGALLVLAASVGAMQNTSGR